MYYFLGDAGLHRRREVGLHDGQGVLPELNSIYIYIYICHIVSYIYIYICHIYIYIYLYIGI